MVVESQLFKVLVRAATPIVMLDGSQPKTAEIGGQLPPIFYRIVVEKSQIGQYFDKP